MANRVVPRATLTAGARAFWHDRPDVLAKIDAEPDEWGSWWMALDGLTGEEGAAFLDGICGRMWECAEAMRDTNPANGWGDFDSFAEVLQAMRDAGRQYPSARWRTSG